MGAEMEWLGLENIKVLVTSDKKYLGKQFMDISNKETYV